MIFIFIVAILTCVMAWCAMQSNDSLVDTIVMLGLVIYVIFFNNYYALQAYPGTDLFLSFLTFTFTTFEAIYFAVVTIVEVVFIIFAWIMKFKSAWTHGWKTLKKDQFRADPF